MKNKIYTLSYFRKRLVENDISSVRLINSFETDDTRYWMILISPGKQNIICTCYRSSPDRFFFKLNTKKGDLQIHTLSMEVLITELKHIIEPSPPLTTEKNV